VLVGVVLAPGVDLVAVAADQDGLVVVELPDREPVQPVEEVGFLQRLA
jgi:hypothetical protein